MCSNFCHVLKRTVIILIDEVDDDFYHRILFFCTALSDHKCQGYEGVVGDTFCAIFIEKYAVTIWKP